MHKLALPASSKFNLTVPLAPLSESSGKVQLEIGA
jgi:hypothetical protein